MTLITSVKITMRCLIVYTLFADSMQEVLAAIKNGNKLYGNGQYLYDLPKEEM